MGLKFLSVFETSKWDSDNRNIMIQKLKELEVAHLYNNSSND